MADGERGAIVNTASLAAFDGQIDVVDGVHDFVARGGTEGAGDAPGQQRGGVVGRAEAARDVFQRNDGRPRCRAHAIRSSSG